MARLKFEMWPYIGPGNTSLVAKEYGGYMSRFTDGRGISTNSWWSAPPSSIDHVGPEYLKQPYRHPNVRNARHNDFIKARFKEEIAKLRIGNSKNERI